MAGDGAETEQGTAAATPATAAAAGGGGETALVAACGTSAADAGAGVGEEPRVEAQRSSSSLLLPPVGFRLSSDQAAGEPEAAQGEATSAGSPRESGASHEAFALASDGSGGLRGGRSTSKADSVGGEAVVAAASQHERPPEEDVEASAVEGGSSCRQEQLLQQHLLQLQRCFKTWGDHQESKLQKAVETAITRTMKQHGFHEKERDSRRDSKCSFGSLPPVCRPGRPCNDDKGGCNSAPASVIGDGPGGVSRQGSGFIAVDSDPVSGFSGAGGPGGGGGGPGGSLRRRSVCLAAVKRASQHAAHLFGGSRTARRQSLFGGRRNQVAPFHSVMGEESDGEKDKQKEATQKKPRKFGSSFMNLGALFHHGDKEDDDWKNIGMELSTNTLANMTSFAEAPYTSEVEVLPSSASQRPDAKRAGSVRKATPYSVVSRPSATFDARAEYRRRQMPSRSSRFQCITSLVATPCFDLFCGFIIVINSALIGIETEYMTTHPEGNPMLVNMQTAFNFWYVVELTLRIAAERVGFVTSKNARWNAFDTILVSISLLEFFVEMLHHGGMAIMGRLLRSLRVLRVVRTLRLVRMLKYIREFRKMIFSISASMQTLFWSLFLLAVMMYMFAVFFTQGVTEFLHGEDRPDGFSEADMLALQEAYGSLSRSIFSLYTSISGGVNWSLVARPLLHVHWVFMAFFLVYISISMFGVLNILTSVFVESAMQSANHYRDLLVQEKMHDKEMYAGHMREVFKVIDVDGSGAISPEELELFLGDENLMMYLEALEINMVETRSLFKLLDRNDSGTVDIDEFCEGCLRLKGDAKSFDIHCLIYENQRTIMKWKEFMKYVETKLEAISPSPAVSVAGDDVGVQHELGVVEGQNPEGDTLAATIGRSPRNLVPAGGLLG